MDRYYIGLNDDRGIFEVYENIEYGQYGTRISIVVEVF